MSPSATMMSWPDELGTGLVRDILALGEPAVEADAELIRLGAQFRGRPCPRDLGQ